MAAVSGRPDGRLAKYIYDGGLGGVIDWRLGAVANDSPEEAAKVEAKVENGTYRGLEKLVKSHATSQNRTSYTGAFQNIDISKGLNAKVGDSIWVTNGSDWFIRVISGMGTAEDATNDVQVFWRDVVTGGSRAKGDAAILVQETNISVSGEFNTQMVIGDPANILLTDALKEGWLGTWCPIIPKLIEQEYPLTRDATNKSASLLYMPNYTTGVWETRSGVSWAWNSVTNSHTVTIADSAIVIVPYKAFAKPTKPTKSKSVYNANAGLLGVTVTQSHDKAALAESVAGIILKSDASGIITEQSNPVKFLVNEVIERITSLATDMVAPTNSSQAIKIAVYQISENGQVSLGFIANTMTHNGTDWGELDEIIIPFGDLEVDTFNDANGILQTAQSTMTAIPMGWTSNHARAGSQVEGVDL